jgi:hypothetical protein
MNSACQSFSGRNPRAAARSLARIIRQFISICPYFLPCAVAACLFVLVFFMMSIFFEVGPIYCVTAHVTHADIINEASTKADVSHAQCLMNHCLNKPWHIHPCNLCSRLPLLFQLRHARFSRCFFQGSLTTVPFDAYLSWQSWIYTFVYWLVAGDF